jgi:arsenate reductase-like glutaredoxin family protein
LDKENVVDYYYQEQQENFLHTIMEQQQMELEQLIQIAENLKNDIIKLHDQEQELIQRLNILKTSQTSLLNNIYSFVSNKNVLFFGMNKHH